VFEPFGFIDNLLIEDFSTPSVLWGIDGDWMVNLIPSNSPFYPTDHCGVLRSKSDLINPVYLRWILFRQGKEAGFSRHHRASIDRIQGLSITVPAKDIQDNLVSYIAPLYDQINAAKDIISSIPQKKEAVLKKYL